MTFKEQLMEARADVEAAQDALEAQPTTYGGHLSSAGTSTLDGPSDVVIHTDGRVMRLVRLLDPADTPYATALAVYRGRWLVVPAHRLRKVGA